MQQIEYHLFPAIKRTAGLLAQALRYTLWGCAATAVAEILLLPMHLPLPGILSGMVSSFLYSLGIALLSILAAWCCPVLVAGQGIMPLRWLLRVGALLAPLAPVSWLYTLFAGKLLLYRQAELPLILGVLLVIAALVNLPRMAAASWQLRLRIVLLPVLLVLVYCIDIPGLLLPCVAFKLLLAWVASAPLQQLASLAPRIISMPEID